MKFSVSVILCTHNPRSEYLRRALDSLRAQTTPPECWEFLLVDNGSKEQLAEHWDLSWHPRARHVREDAIGLTAARLRGIKESSGELVVFIDDDNVLAPDYLEQAEAILTQRPYLGVFGAGVLAPEFAVQPPPELLPWLNLLALRTVSSVIWTNNFEDANSIPWGAGLCVTRAVANYYPQLLESLNVSEVLGRRGQQLLCGEDDVFSWASIQLGQGFGLFPELRVTHLMPAERLNRRYFLRLIYGHRFSIGILHYLLSGTPPRRLNLDRYLRLFLHAIKNGLYSTRLQWAASLGAHRAARFLAENGLIPMKNTSRIE